jgi:predicted AAA+ superfamily ATPase
MDPRFLHHNTHLINPKEFEDRDPQLRYISKQPYIFHSSLIHEFPVGIPGIYTLSGGRQIGKSTLLKQWMLHLLKMGNPPEALAFLSGELIQDHFMLLHLLQRQLEGMPQGKMKYVILDEVNYIDGWDKAIKFAADAGLLEETTLFLTGSDHGFIKEARMRFPGRRGKASIVDFHYYPLSFKEAVELKKGSDVSLDTLYEQFKEYLVHGGFLTAINDMATTGQISPSTLTTYSDWIRGDMLKRGKQEHYLREVILGILKRYGSQVTWNSLAKDQSIDHPQTIYDYTTLLEEMDAVFVQKALMENELTGAPKKARKIYFADPFIYHAMQAWIYPDIDPYKTQILPKLDAPEVVSNWAEGCAVTHYRRFYSTYYIKGSEGEVDIAYIDEKKFWPVEIKWANQIHAKDLKQLSKYHNPLLLTKSKREGELGQIPTFPLPLALYQIGEKS